MKGLVCIVVLFLMISSCVLGFLIHKYRWFPFHQVQDAYYRYIESGRNPEFDTVNPHYRRTDVRSLISMASHEDALQLKNQLTGFVWGPSGLPIGKLPSEVHEDHTDERYDNLRVSSLERIDRILVTMEFDLESTIYHFIPKSENKRLLIFHQGHGGDFIANKPLITEALSRGYAVAGFCMPLLGLNNTPDLYLPRFGYVRIRSHDYIKLLDPGEGHPVKYFLEPVVVFLNYAGQHYDYVDVAMVGTSGGGWTTTLVAAMDTRIASSFPVAGSYPIYLRGRRDWGDWEQTVPELYRVANYAELYILGSFGRGRRQLQIVNKYDPCCFAGIKWRTYEPVIKSVVGSLGEGNWSLFMDDSNVGHVISLTARRKILDELDARIDLRNVIQARGHLVQ
jgi:hypothetical protein